MKITYPYLIMQSYSCQILLLLMVLSNVLVSLLLC